MDESLYDEMFRLESRHWWFVARRRIILSLLAKHFQPNGSRRVCDIGCGCGMMLLDLRNAGYEPIGIDTSEKALEYCHARGVQALQGQLPEHLNLKPESIDAVLMLDVLEHLDDDQTALVSAARLVKPGGLLIATVPAYQWLWTERDQFHHHKRRYSAKGWRQLLGSAEGFQPLTVSHFNSMLIPPMLLARLISKVIRAKSAGDLWVPPLGINSALARTFAFERHLLRGQLTLPFGLSLLAIMRKVQQ